MPHADFFTVHAEWGWLVLIGLALFPRITLLFVGGAFGPLAWLGWVICPHLLVAILGTTYYWDTNPVLCIVAWFFAFAGTGGEGRFAHHHARRSRRRDRADGDSAEVGSR
ncbi:MAG: hypothetical protein AB7S26_40695 [Sandaracinaceae bacterium]